MKLLIITQKVDTNDSVLGFFHEWIKELALHCESLVVICLEKGKYDLPDNVKVFSLGKERGRSRLKYLFNFYKFIWRFRYDYEKVFVHMNQEYVLLGGLFWKIFKREVFLWRNHLKGNFLTRIAVLMSDTVFCTSEQSFTARFEKTKITPVGVFLPDDNLSKNKNKKTLLFLGRISPVKNIHIFIEALIELNNRGVEFKAIVEGDPVNTGDDKYLQSLKDSGKQLIKLGKLEFRHGLPLDKTMETFASSGIYINLTPSGSLDKSIFGSMAAHTPVIVANSYFKGVLSEDFIINKITSDVVADHIEKVLYMTDNELSAVSDKNYDYVKNNHSLEKTIEEILKAMI